MTDLVAYYSQVVKNMQLDIDVFAFDKEVNIRDKVHKKHMNYLIKSRTKDLNRTIKKLEKLKTLNKPFDPFDYCEGVSEEQKQAIRNSPTALEKVTEVAKRIQHSPFKHTHVWRTGVWCIFNESERIVAYTTIKKGKLLAAQNRYFAYPNITDILVTLEIL